MASQGRFPSCREKCPNVHLEERLDNPDQSAANPQNFTEQEAEFNRLQAHGPLPGTAGSSLMLWWQQTRAPKGPESTLGHWTLHIAHALTAPFQVHDTQRCRRPSTSCGGASPASPELSHRTLGHSQAGDTTATEEADVAVLALLCWTRCGMNWLKSASKTCWVPGSLRRPGSAWKESGQSRDNPQQPLDHCSQLRTHSKSTGSKYLWYL